MSIFEYDKAFYCNIGWAIRLEQNQLRHKRVAIVGMEEIWGFIY